MKIYVASSWRNLWSTPARSSSSRRLQPGIVHVLRRLGHDVYDFRNPKPGNTGFSWREIDPAWESWTIEQYRAGLQHPIAQAGYELDRRALAWCDACVLVLPAGRSAAFELGYAMGLGKRGYVLALERVEPELMFSEATLLGSMNDVFDAFGEPAT